MNKLIWWNRIALFLLFIGIAILGLAFTLQPKISDDWLLLWSYQKSPGGIAFINEMYTGFTGRAWLILLAAYVLPNPLVEIAYRAFIVVEVILLAALAWYCAVGPGAWRRTWQNIQALAIFGTLLWFALPARNETVSWLTGNSVYLVPALFGLAFMAWIERALGAPVAGRETHHRRVALYALSFLVGFLAGVSQEQILAACGAYLVLTLIRIRFDRLPGWPRIGAEVWIAVLGLVAGAAVLVSSPGNFTRMGAIALPSMSGVIERMTLFIPGAFFELGTGTTGKNIWLGALVFVLLYFRFGDVVGEMTARLKRGIFWWVVSLTSLLAMAPATNFISLRTSFFAIVFFFVGVAAMTYRAPSDAAEGHTGSSMGNGPVQHGNAAHFALSTAVLTVIACLVVVDAVAGLISNASVAAEFSRRIEIVERARLSASTGDNAVIRVPFIATETAALTFIQNPQHDREFLDSWGKRIGRTIQHDESVGAALPNSFNPLKAIKFRDRK